MVRLKGPISASAAGESNSFQASIDQPVLVEGNTLIPRGTVVTGRVQSARSSKVKPGRGYVQLALNSVHIAGADLPMQTASLFVRQSAGLKTSKNTVSSAAFHLDKGYRLTFRLTEPVYTAVQSSNPPAHMTP
jgi:hypothetical protein